MCWASSFYDAPGHECKVIRSIEFYRFAGSCRLFFVIFHRMPRYESSHELVIRQKKAKNEALNTYGGGAGPQGGGYHRGGLQGGQQGHRGPAHNRGVLEDCLYTTRGLCIGVLLVHKSVTGTQAEEEGSSSTDSTGDLTAINSTVTNAGVAIIDLLHTVLITNLTDLTQPHSILVQSASETRWHRPRA